MGIWKLKDKITKQRRHQRLQNLHSLMYEFGNPKLQHPDSHGSEPPVDRHPMGDVIINKRSNTEHRPLFCRELYVTFQSIILSLIVRYVSAYYFIIILYVTFQPIILSLIVRYVSAYYFVVNSTLRHKIYCRLSRIAPRRSLINCPV
jgi:hypothetical protein